MSKIIANQIQHTQNGAQAFTLPASDGSTGQLIKTDGSGALSFTDAGIDGVTTGSGNVTITDGDLINGATNATINTIGGHYVKVGRFCYLTFFCDWSNASNHGNYIYFNGFPFLSASNVGQDYVYGIGSCQIDGFSFGNGGPQLHQGQAATGCNLVSNVSGGNSQNDGPTNTGRVFANISYITNY